MAHALSLSALLSIGIGYSLFTGCDPGSVGDPCIPEDEYRSSFSGYSASEVNVENRSFQCGSRVCITNHFQGRVSCPYGQTESDLALAPDDPSRCRVPGTAGSEPQDAIEVAVSSWLVERTPEDAVYCSCRCDGPDPGANYCECPAGYACQELVLDLGLSARRQLSGSYCVKEGTQYTALSSTLTCAESPDRENCPEPQGVNP